MAINIDRLSAEIEKELSVYSQDIVDKIDVSSERVAKMAVKKLKETSPKDDGDYAKGWRKKEDKYIADPNSYIIHNKTDYQLTHLLEYGHAYADGTDGVDAIPHIGPVEEEVIKEFTEEVEEAIKNG